MDGQKLTFYVSGKLWGRSLVMGDKETGSDWSHILGRCMAGKMKGKSLTIIPATMTTWQAWVADHPETTVTMIPPTARQFTQDLLQQKEEFCIGLVHHGESRHWRFDLLESVGIANDRLGELDLVAYFDTKHTSAGVWNRLTEHGPLTFEQTARGIVDRETQSIWDIRKGQAIEGKLKGTRLTPTAAIVSFSHAWRRFHPETTQWNPTDTADKR